MSKRTSKVIEFKKFVFQHPNNFKNLNKYVNYGFIVVKGSKKRPHFGPYISIGNDKYIVRNLTSFKFATEGIISKVPCDLVVTLKSVNTSKDTAITTVQVFDKTDITFNRIYFDNFDPVYNQFMRTHFGSFLFFNDFIENNKLLDSSDSRYSAIAFRLSGGENLIHTSVSGGWVDPAYLRTFLPVIVMPP